MSYIHQKVTSFLINFLFSLHGLPILNTRHSFLWNLIFGVVRVSARSFVNLYAAYRLYKSLTHLNFTYDTFPLINAAVSACVVDSFAIYTHRHEKFSILLFNVLKKRDIYLSTPAICRLMVVFSFFSGYVLVCAILFPIHANHWFDAASNLTSPDFFHMESIRPCTHITIFVMCGGSIVSHLMLYCFVCCLLQQILVSLLADIQSSTKPRDGPKLEYFHEFRSRFIEVSNLIKCADKIFSLFGLVALGSAFARACSCIHFYLNMKSPFRDSWSFILLQIAFDFSGLTAVCCFAADVAEEGRKLSPAVLHTSTGVSIHNSNFHLQCLSVSKIVMSSSIHLSAWRLFPFSRKVLPTVIGAIVSYVAVIIQMHIAASFDVTALEKSVPLSKANYTNLM